MEEQGSGPDPSLMAGIVKSSAQLGTLGGKAADTSAVSDYAKSLEQKKSGRNARLASYLSNLKAEKNKGLLAQMKMKSQERGRRDKKDNWDRKVAYERQKRDEQRSYDEGKKREELTIPGVGIGRSLQDVKDIKSGTAEKKKFDSYLDEMIALRKKHGGGNITNRADVARGKQLSKDMLLAYKNMAKLGVLSKSDEDIVNTIIAADPLAYSASDFGLGGDDAILHTLQQLKRSQNKDYMNQINLRVKDINPELLSDYDSREQMYVDMEKPKKSGQGLMDESTAMANDGEVRRKTKDGRTAVFNSKTKEFIRYD
jgi:Skp family chaperone for outer membrane proteins